MGFFSWWNLPSAKREFLRGIGYDDLKSNTPICESYVSAMRAMGHHTLFDNSQQKGALSGGSTDMGLLKHFVHDSCLPRLTAH
jgi:hypothetical protein